MKFAKGQSGNPAGGKPGPRHSFSHLRKQMAEKGPAVVDRVITAALAGDMVAARLVLERLVPAFKSQAEAIYLELPSGSLTDQAMAILRAATSGEIPPDLGAELIAAAGGVAKVQEADETQKHIADLERQVDELSQGLVPTPSAEQMRQQIQQARDERDAEQFGDLA